LLRQLPTNEEICCIQRIMDETKRKNMDNISRTKAYLKFFQLHPEISWSFLASMVSRNGGWNMCDLQGAWFPLVLTESQRYLLFLAYERANWFIFHDAYPQLLLYHYSTKMQRPMFHLLPFFHVSSFMRTEWDMYWEGRDGKRLMTSLIINEQNVIQKQVIEHPFFKSKVFRSLAFYLQDWFHFGAVLFPTLEGKLYGASVSGFQKVDKRIDLGKRLADILFAPNLFPMFLKFALKTEHTGSRHDYEQFFRIRKFRDTPYLRTVYPIVRHYVDEYQDWSKKQKVKKGWYQKIEHKEPILLTDWYLKKQKQMQAYILMRHIFAE
jgi:hypothetical protein